MKRLILGLFLLLFAGTALATQSFRVNDNALMLWSNETVAVDGAQVFTLLQRHLPATLTCSGIDASEELELQIQFTNTAITSVTAADFVEITVDSTTYQLDANTNSRTINSPGVYRVYSATEQTGVSCAVGHRTTFGAGG